MKILHESSYLLLSNRERCRNILLKARAEWTEQEIIDTYVALHIVLEVGLNALYRQLSMPAERYGIDDFDIIKNVDSISFIDKTTLFIYNSRFDFGNQKSKAGEYHRAINMLKDFSMTRNSLLHGHALISISENDILKHSSIKQKVTADKLTDQLEKFIFITDGIAFFVEHLDSGLTVQGKRYYREHYLNNSFIPASALNKATKLNKGP